ncbi:hypothetical protein MTsPCn9_10440 [Croceitalea sp. MTPC9]|uniref:PIN domain-containing protein n=1 Tax=unclassified Croceitalea TaxID=2632280 RepID=UPI002B3B9F1F|nr:hypothetical protein MTsPCn6_26800 [Croceitalea sp. MTPC6]GMN16108.1 hypothetical protein MTsPCn9_10440 [Croceitalea sp. MTPC9]
MDYIFIDTSIFKSNNFIESKRIQEVFRLAKEGHIKILMPEVTYNEILNRARKNLEEALKSFNRYRRDTRVLRNIASLREKFDPLEQEACLVELTSAIEAALKEANIEMLRYPILDTKIIFDSYFQNKKPFGAGIKKSEFPDALALISVEEWCKVHNKNCTLFAEDRDLIEYESKLLSHRNFNEFLDEKLKTVEATAKRAKRLARIAQLYADKSDTYIAQITDWLKTQLDDESKYYHHIDYFEVHDMDVQEVYVELLEYEITSVSEEVIYLEAEAIVQYEVEITTDDQNSGYYDGDDKTWHFFDTTKVKIEEEENINVTFEYAIPEAGEKFAELKLLDINDGNDLDI